jgi:hypothetical protein
MLDEEYYLPYNHWFIVFSSLFFKEVRQQNKGHSQDKVSLVFKCKSGLHASNAYIYRVFHQIISVSTANRTPLPFGGRGSLYYRIHNDKYAN